MHTPKRLPAHGFTALESVVMLALLTVFSMVTVAVVKKGVSHTENTPSATANADAPTQSSLPTSAPKPVSPPSPTKTLPRNAGTAGSVSPVESKTKGDDAK